MYLAFFYCQRAKGITKRNSGQAAVLSAVGHEKNMKDSKKSYAISEVRATDYIEHAKEINSIARTTLRLETRDASWLSGKMSLGLSLQAGELAGKAILRSLGHTVEQIRKEHAKHDLLTLLRKAEMEIKIRPEEEFKPYYHFLLWTPEIDGVKYGNTIGSYLNEHFSRGASARPRNYFYPDESVFTGSVPIHALLVMVDYLIELVEKIDALAKFKVHITDMLDEISE